MEIASKMRDIEEKMGDPNENIDIKKCILSNNYSKINSWLKDNLHIYGSTDKPTNLFRKCVSSDFDSDIYIKYLTQKYGR